ncbi:MAG: ATP-binding protein [Pseudomonadota bacterium]
MADYDTEELRSIADAIPYPVIYVTADGAVGFTNRALRRINGLPANPSEGERVENLLGEEESNAGRTAFLECLHSNRRVVREGHSALPDAPIRYCRYVYAPVRRRDGSVQGVCCTVVDLTDVKEAERALQSSRDELARSNRDLEQFAYVASHDLKAPLRSIEVLVGWLAEDLAEHHQGDVQENLELLKARTTRLNRLLDDLLAYSRVGRRVGDVARVDTRELVEDIWTLMAPPEGFELRVGDDLPELITFRAPLEQVLRNLIGNAVKHHPGPRGHVWVEADVHDDHVVFSVRDDGAGIDAEYRDRVYQMFQTLQPRDEVEGSGMGLAIVSRVVEWQGGRIWHEDPPQGTGTVFRFEWKLVDQASADALMAASSENRSQAA